MKVWVKLLAGSVLGLLLGFFLPADNQQIAKAVELAAGMAISIGRYAVVPLLLFSLMIAVYELRQDGGLWRIVLQSFLVMAISAVLVIGVGIIATVLFSPARIPITHDEQVEDISLTLLQNVADLFPQNMFSALVSDGVYLFPICVFAFFVGMALSFDKSFTKPVVALIDSISRIFYHVASFFSEILGVVIIALSAYWALRYRNMVGVADFRGLIILLAITSVFLAFIILPLLLYGLKNKPHPWAAVYASLASALAAFFSGDINFSLPVVFRHTKESLGVRRRVGSISVPLFATFGRAGSAMVAAASFIVIIKSYSSLGITAADVLSIGVKAFLISFLLARHPGDGAFTALAVLCASYGKGFEAGYFILKPIAFYLIAIGTFLDVMIMYFAGYFIGKADNLQEDKAVRHFI
jgi:Na+/H+-dicarboxylate symporter